MRSQSPNVEVERHAAALSQLKLLHPDSSIPSDVQRRYAACPLQRKLGVAPHPLPNPRHDADGQYKDRRNAAENDVVEMRRKHMQEDGHENH